jgi:signal transduction protein with GAF and PtsI domain
MATKNKKRGIEPKPYRDLTALSRVSAALSELRDLDAVLDVALDTVLSVMEGTIGGILLIDEQTGTLSYRVYRGLSDKYVEEMRLKIGEGIAGNVAKSGKAVLLEDISSDPDAARHDLISTEGLKAFISVPLRAKDSILGVLNVASRLPHHFTKDDMHLLYAIGDQVGVAVEQAELYEKLKMGRERYQRLAQHILVSREEERKRLARELHDGTSQTLTGLSLSLQALMEMSKTYEAMDDTFREHLIKIPLNPGLVQRLGQLRLPDPLRQPYASRRIIEFPAHSRSELRYLTQLIIIRDYGQDRLIVSAGHYLHLASVR